MHDSLDFILLGTLVHTVIKIKASSDIHLINFVVKMGSFLKMKAFIDLIISINNTIEYLIPALKHTR